MDEHLENILCMLCGNQIEKPAETTPVAATYRHYVHEHPEALLESVNRHRQQEPVTK